MFVANSKLIYLSILFILFATNQIFGQVGTKNSLRKVDEAFRPYKEKSRDWLVARTEDNAASFELAHRLAKKGEAKSAFEKFRESANRGHLPSMVMMLVAFFHGNGVEKDMSAARKWNAKCMKHQDCKDFEFLMGYIWENNLGLSNQVSRDTYLEHYNNSATYRGNKHAISACKRLGYEYGTWIQKRDTTDDITGKRLVHFAMPIKSINQAKHGQILRFDIFVENLDAAWPKMALVINTWDKGVRGREYRQLGAFQRDSLASPFKLVTDKRTVRDHIFGPECNIRVTKYDSGVENMMSDVIWQRSPEFNKDPILKFANDCKELKLRLKGIGDVPDIDLSAQENRDLMRLLRTASQWMEKNAKEWK